MVELPSVKNKRWYFHSWVLELILAFLAAIWALLTAIKLLRDPSAGSAECVGAFIVAGLIFVVSSIKAWRSRAAEIKYQPIEEPKDLAGLIRGIHGSLCQINQCEGDALGVRITVYKVIWDRQRLNPIKLEQVTKYFGGLGGLPGRRYSARAGIIGRAARMAEPYKAKRESADADAFRSELVGVWGYTSNEAESVSPERWAWLAFPLLGDDEAAYGVVFLDSKKPELFDDERVTSAIVNGCSLIAEEARAVYNR